MSCPAQSTGIGAGPCQRWHGRTCTLGFSGLGSVAIVYLVGMMNATVYLTRARIRPHACHACAVPGLRSFMHSISSIYATDDVVCVDRVWRKLRTCRPPPACPWPPARSCNDRISNTLHRLPRKHASQGSLLEQMRHGQGRAHGDLLAAALVDLLAVLGALLQDDRRRHGLKQAKPSAVTPPQHSRPLAPRRTKHAR